MERVGRRKQININLIFGVVIPSYNETVSNTHKFTGHERDYYTNYDYMHFRFYASSMGRFLKPDNIIPDLTNPQNWNAYTYVEGNPVNFDDPSGHDLRGKQGKMGMSFALAGVPNVDISGRLTEVEMYEFFGSNIYSGNYQTAGEYYRASYAAAQSASARGFKFYSPYGYTASSGSLYQSVQMGNNAPSAAPCGDDSTCIEEREAYVSIVVWQMRGLFQIYYPNIYSSFLNFDIHYEDVDKGGWIQGDFTGPRVGVKAFDLSYGSAWRVENGKITYRKFSDVFIKLSLTILHEFAHYYLRESNEAPVVKQAYTWYIRFLGEKW